MKAHGIISTKTLHQSVNTSAARTVDGPTADDFIEAAYCLGLAIGFARVSLMDAMRELADRAGLSTCLGRATTRRRAPAGKGDSQ